MPPAERNISWWKTSRLQDIRVVSKRLELEIPKSSHDETHIFSGQATYKVPTTDAANAELEIFPPSSSPYLCSAETGELCQFPFGLKGANKVHWHCERRFPKCSPGSNDDLASWSKNKKLRFFESKVDFHECTACNWTQLPCFQHGVAYDGFLLSRFQGRNIDISNLERCSMQVWKTGKNARNFASWLIPAISSTMEDTTLQKDISVTSNMGLEGK